MDSKDRQLGYCVLLIIEKGALEPAQLTAAERVIAMPVSNYRQKQENTEL